MKVETRCILRATALSVALLGALQPIPALASQQLLTPSPAVGPPTSATAAIGEGIAPGERVVLGFDRRSVGTTRAGLYETFSEEVNVPVEATPREHISARGALSGQATATFTGQTDWPTARFVPEGTGHNPYENVLSPSTVGNLELAWSRPSRYF